MTAPADPALLVPGAEAPRPPAGTGLAGALAPVRDALLAAARADADRALAQAGQQADTVLAEARRRAERIVAEARASGLADAAAEASARRARARRDARATVLSARREAYQRLGVRCRTAVAALADEPDYAALRARLVAAAERRLGPSARIADADGGGIVATAGDRRLDLALVGLADRAVAAVAAEDPP